MAHEQRRRGRCQAFRVVVLRYPETRIIVLFGDLRSANTVRNGLAGRHPFTQRDEIKHAQSWFWPFPDYTRHVKNLSSIHHCGISV